MRSRFYICRACGNLVSMLNDAGVPLLCCGQKMEPLVPNTTEAAGEKHLPVVSVDGQRVQVNVGAVHHPMAEEHHIAWVYLATERGSLLRYLTPDVAPEVIFCLGEEKAVAAYAYCNLHGLWMTEL